MSTHAVFARRLRAVRSAAGLSQAAVAEHLTTALGRAIDPSAVARIEADRRMVKLDEAVAIADLLDCDLAELLRDPDPIGDEIEGLERRLVEVEEAAARARQEQEDAEAEAEDIREGIAELEAQRAEAERAVVARELLEDLRAQQM